MGSSALLYRYYGRRSKDCIFIHILEYLQRCDLIYLYVEVALWAIEIKSLQTDPHHELGIDSRSEAELARVILLLDSSGADNDLFLQCLDAHASKQEAEDNSNC